MTISASMVKELRDKTGAGMMDCKKALNETKGNIEEAVKYLREKGLADASKKSGRIATAGTVSSYIHMGGKLGVLAEINCETDFVAKTDEFKNFVENVAMQIAAFNPVYVSTEDVDENYKESEKEIYRNQLADSGKPANIIEQIVEGKLVKGLSEVCLLEQGYFRDEKIKIKDLLKETIAKLGENIVIRRFVRFELGEGLEKKSVDLRAEVEKEISKTGK